MPAPFDAYEGVPPWPPPLPEGATYVPGPPLWQPEARVLAFSDPERLWVASPSSTAFTTGSDHRIDGDYVACWNVRTRQREGAWPLRGVSALVPHPDGALWVSGRGWVGVWRPNQGPPEVVFVPGVPVRIDVHPDGRRFAFVGASVVGTWSPEAGATYLTGGGQDVFAVAWLEDRVVLATAGRLAIWDPQNSAIVRGPHLTAGAGSGTQLLVDRLGITVGFANGLLARCDPHTLTPRWTRTYQNPLLGMARTPDDGLVVTSSKARDTLLLDAEGDVRRAAPSLGVVPRGQPRRAHARGGRAVADPAV